jgi:hypothetical protein
VTGFITVETRPAFIAHRHPDIRITIKYPGCCIQEMKRGIQGVTWREQPKLPITMSVASTTVLESLRNSQKYN